MQCHREPHRSRARQGADDGSATSNRVFFSSSLPKRNVDARTWRRYKGVRPPALANPVQLENTMPKFVIEGQVRGAGKNRDVRPRPRIGGLLAKQLATVRAVIHAASA
jgi:hypothetical protein